MRNTTVTTVQKVLLGGARREICSCAKKRKNQITHLTLDVETLNWYKVFNCTNGSSLCCRWSTQRTFFFDVACCDVCCVRIVFVFFFTGWIVLFNLEGRLLFAGRSAMAFPVRCKFRGGNHAPNGECQKASPQGNFAICWNYALPVCATQVWCILPDVAFSIGTGVRCLEQVQLQCAEKQEVEVLQHAVLQSAGKMCSCDALIRSDSVYLDVLTARCLTQEIHAHSCETCSPYFTVSHYMDDKNMGCIDQTGDLEMLRRHANPQARSLATLSASTWCLR